MDSEYMNYSKKEHLVVLDTLFLNHIIAAASWLDPTQLLGLLLVHF